MYIYLGWFRVFGVSYKADVRGQYLCKSPSGCINIEHKTYVNLARKQINLRYSTERRYLNRILLREQFPSYILEWGGLCLKLFVKFIFKGLTDCVFASRILFDSRAPWVCLVRVNNQTCSAVCLFESWLIIVLTSWKKLIMLQRILSILT